MQVGFFQIQLQWMKKLTVSNRKYLYASDFIIYVYHIKICQFLDMWYLGENKMHFEFSLYQFDITKVSHWLNLLWFK